MTQKKIDQLRELVKELRGRLTNIKFSEMITLAEMVGRTQRPKSSPPMYVTSLKGRRSLPIHYHPGCMKRGTAKNSLDILEGDIDAWELQLDESNDCQ